MCEFGIPFLGARTKYGLLFLGTRRKREKADPNGLSSILVDPGRFCWIKDGTGLDFYGRYRSE